jgi:dipeptidyl aminopeptidase/acylaminoacyl peptidase
MRASWFRATCHPVTWAAVVVAAFTTRSPAQAPQAMGAASSTTPMSAADRVLATEGYVLPPDPIARLVNAPRESNFTYSAVSPGARKYLIHVVGDGMPTLDQLGRPHYNLGGFQVDYVANRLRSLNTSSAVGIDLYDWVTGTTKKIEIPAGARISRTVAWSPDGNTMAFMAEFPASNQIYLADPVTGKSRALTTTGLLATNVTNFEWTADGKSIVAVLVPDARGPEPKESPIASEPMVRLNENRLLHTSVFPSLLESPRDKALVEYYTTGQLAVIDVRTRAVKKIGAPGMIRSLDASPDAKYFRATYLDKPFSYIIPVSSFGTTEVVIDGTGRVLAQLVKRPLRETQDARTDTTGGRGAPGGGRGGAAAAVDTGRRNLAWHPFDPGMIYFKLAPAVAGQRNDSASASARHDRLMQWLPPFDTSAAGTKQLYETSGRIGAVQFSDNGRIMFVTETSGATNAIFLDEGGKSYPVIAATVGRNGRSNTGAPQAGGRGGGRGGAAGSGTSALVTRPGSRGVPVVMIAADGQHVFRQGGGSAPAGGTPNPADSVTRPASRPWVERIDIKSGAVERIYQSTSDLTETISAPLDDDFTKAIISRESATVPPQSYVLDLKSGDAKQITTNRDLMPEITNAIRKTVMARRADGHTFKIKVTLPPDWKPGTRLPALFWFYPAEFANQEAYDRPAGGAGAAGAASNRFPVYGARTMAFITTVGYALIEPDTPIFSQNGQPPNDHYVDDLRDDLSATIDALDTLGYIDRQKLAIGGHSYGAFSTANAMVHTPFFKAGIAGDGDYNRTLTPTGFQNERRDLWAGRETYLNMSPFLYADHLNGALLMYHSMEDQNVGTAPINSIRMFQALQSLGKTTALYMYPYEDHGPVTKETDLDQWARWVNWLDKYVKGTPKQPLTP